MRRRKKPRKIVQLPKTRAELEQEYGRTWDTQELAHDYIVTAIIDNTVVVRRKADDVVGTLRFQSDPALYFGFKAAPAMESEKS